MEQNMFEVMGKKFLKCNQKDCQWNVAWPNESNWGKGVDDSTRICDLGAKAIIETDAIPPDECKQPSLVFELAAAEFEF